MISDEEIKQIREDVRTILKDDNKTAQIFSQLVCAVKIAVDKDNKAGGVILLSGRSLFFLSGGTFEELVCANIVDIRSTPVPHGGQEISLQLKQRTMRFKIQKDEDAQDFLAMLRERIEVRENNVVFYDYSANYEFITEQAKKILTQVEPYFSKQNSAFCKLLVNDLISIAFFVVNSKKLLSEKEMFFMTLVLLPLHQEIKIADKEKICQAINEFELGCVGMVIKMWPKVARFFPEKMAAAELSFESLGILQEIDAEEGSAHADIIRKALFNFAQCLIKADGRITAAEIAREEKLNAAIFQKNDLKKNTSSSGDKKTKVKTAAAKSEDKKSLKTGVEEEAETLESVLAKINALVGMNNIKKEINTLINLIKIRKKRQERSLPISVMSLHAVFHGPPGTGKTTVARLLGKAYRAIGLLEKGHIIETDRAGLVAGYVGQTAIQVDKIVEEALDGVLFIDEAYALKPRGGTGNDFGQEAIDTILKRMEDNRERLVVIVAGYPDEMKEFIESNPGLKSRFSRYFYFEDYKPAELFKIFEIFTKNAAYVLAKPAAAKLLEILKSLYAHKDRTFGNGRLVRNIFEKVIENQANRLVQLSSLTDEALSSIQKADIPEEKDLTDNAPQIVK